MVTKEYVEEHIEEFDDAVKRATNELRETVDKFVKVANYVPMDLNSIHERILECVHIDLIRRGIEEKPESCDVCFDRWFCNIVSLLSDGVRLPTGRRVDWCKFDKTEGVK